MKHRDTIILLSLLSLLLGGCLAGGPAPAAEPPQRVTEPFQSITILPVQFVNGQPDSFCHNDIGDDLRSRLAIRLRERGYRVVVEGDSVPQTFAHAPPPPAPGAEPAPFEGTPPATDTTLEIWIDAYLATTLCERDEPKQLDMAGVAILYAQPERRELGRWRGSASNTGLGTSNDAVWRVTGQLTDQFLVGIP